MNCFDETSAGDVALTDGGDLAPLVSGEAAMRLHLQNRISSVRGDWFLDLRAGLPWFQKWLGYKGVSTTTIAREIRKNLEAVDFVSSASVTVTIDSERSARIDAKITLVSGAQLTIESFKPWLS